LLWWCVLVLVCVCQINKVWAGPPLNIGDPGILDPGQWEVIPALTAASIGEGHYYEAPLLDVSVGLVPDRLQVSATYRYAHADPEGDSSNWEFGNLELGATWRFWENERWKLAFAPVYAFGVTRKTAELGIGESVDVLALPLVAEYQLHERWRLNASAAYNRAEDEGDIWSYGLATVYTCSDRLELLLEFEGAANSDLARDLLDVRAGFDYAFTMDLHLLFSVATGLREPSSAEKLDADVFLGMQFLF
jgi:outer membrane receptor protein involved in Fe transport